MIGIRLAPNHCNSRGIVHGGVIAALTDNAMGLSYGMLRPGGAASGGTVTVGLTVDHAATAKVCQWLQIAPRVIRGGRSIGSLDALVAPDGAVAARASATLRALD